MHSGGGYNQTVEALQIRLRERDRDVCPLLAPNDGARRSHNVPDRYAYFKRLDYFSTECIYSPDAYRGHARIFLKDLEASRPSAIIDIIHSGEAFEIKDEVKQGQKSQSKSFASYQYV